MRVTALWRGCLCETINIEAKLYNYITMIISASRLLFSNRFKVFTNTEDKSGYFQFHKTTYQRHQLSYNS